MDINQSVIAGRLTKDPDLKYTPSGIASARFTVAVNRSYKNANGDREADFINVQAWRKAAENIANYFKKGDEIGIIGRIQTGSYEGNDGKRVYTTDIVVDSFTFGQKAGSGGAGANRTSQGNQNRQNAGNGQQTGNYTRVEQDPFYNGSGPIEVSDDDLPF